MKALIGSSVNENVSRETKEKTSKYRCNNERGKNQKKRSDAKSDLKDFCD